MLIRIITNLLIPLIIPVRIYTRCFHDKGEIAGRMIQTLAREKGISLEDGVWEDYRTIKERQYVVAGAHIQRLPRFCVQIINGMLFFACKAEQPIARRKGRDMCLIHPADGEGGCAALVAALHGAGVLGVEGAAPVSYTHLA